eukprot:Nk52_evm1s2178 gene=Nk52_evmTU1s2178
MKFLESLRYQFARLSLAFMCSCVILLCIAVFGALDDVAVVAVREEGDSSRIFGLQPHLVETYEQNKARNGGGKFECLDKSGVIPFEAVNDDYCDCEDGSDEPGTSACPNAHFYCVNRMYRPRLLPSSRVGDGICDCCDGSDEAGNPHAKCENTCSETGARFRELVNQHLEISRMGLEKKAENIKWAENRKEEIDQRLVELEHEISELQTESDGKEVILRVGEKEFHEKRDVFVEEWKAKEKERLEAERAEEKKQRAMNREEGEEANGGENEEKEEGNSDGESEEEAKDGEENSEEENKEPEEEEIVVDEPSSDLYPEEVKQLEEAKNTYQQEFDDIFNKLSELKKERDEKQNELGKEYGAEMEFWKLKGECFEKDTDEYVYKLCFMVNAEQNSKRGGSTSLGTFEDWKGDAGSYSKMSYANGQHCWQGPNRSVQVLLECGTENEILSVTEPAKCEYEMRFATPAACSEIPLDGNEEALMNSPAFDHLHDEL